MRDRSFDRSGSYREFTENPEKGSELVDSGWGYDEVRAAEEEIERFGEVREDESHFFQDLGQDELAFVIEELSSGPKTVGEIAERLYDDRYGDEDPGWKESRRRKRELEDRVGQAFRYLRMRGLNFDTDLTVDWGLRIEPRTD
ncbi:MAG: hypothetical protein ABEK01_04770 [Candidatus Nanohaloarchaea archaeon]